MPSENIKPTTFLRYNTAFANFKPPNFMLYTFLKDILDIARLRYQTAETYRQHSSPAATAALLALLGLINAAGMSVLFGNSNAAVAFAVLLTGIKWLTLSVAMSISARYFTKQNVSLSAYTLASEMLGAPMLLVFYVPQLAFFGALWQMWAFWAQALGFIKLTGLKGPQVLIGYVLYFIGSMMLGSAVLLSFALTGLIDVEALNQQLQTMMNTPK